MENIGQKLKQLRVQLALTLEQVEEETRIRTTLITDIENDNTASISLMYLNAYKKTLADFYNKALNNPNYLATVSRISISKNQSENSEIEKQSKKDTAVNQEKENNIYSNESNYKSVFTAVPINPNDIKKIKEIEKVQKIVATEQILEIKTPTNVVEVKSEKQIHTPRKAIKYSNLAILNKKILKNSLNIRIKDLLIYLSGGIIFSTIIFFVFIYDSNGENTKKHQTQYDTTTDSVIAITSTGDDIYKYFEKDSVVLIANCKDSSWIKVEVDNKKPDELIMIPGMQKIWFAADQIILTTANVGGITFYKNDTLLPTLGPKGTMVQNIVITREGIKNINPLSSGNNTVPISELNPNQNVITPSLSDTVKVQIPPRQHTPKKKKEEPVKPIFIDFSKPANTKPPILEKEDD